MSANFSKVDSLGTAFKFRKRKKTLSSLVYGVLHEQRQQRNVEKSVMHVQSGCFANPNQLLFWRPRCRCRRHCRRSTMLSSLISAIFQRSTFMSVHNLSQIKAKGMAYLNGLHGSLCSERAFLYWKWWSFNITIRDHDGNSVIWKQITDMWMREGSLYCNLLKLALTMTYQVTW